MENVVLKGTKIVVIMGAGFAGTDSMEGYILSQDYTADELGDIAWDMGVDHASSYGVYPECDRPEEEEEEEEDDEEIQSGNDDYSDNIEGYWEVYDEKKKHEGHITYGNEAPTFREL